MCQTADVSGRNPEEVGSVVLNWAEFASLDGAEHEKKVAVATSAAITGVVGQPELSFTIRRAQAAARGART